MSARKAAAPAPDLVITDEEIAELEAPWRVEVGSRGTITLKSSNSFSLDDFYTVADKADEDPRQVVDLITYDTESAELLRRSGRGILERILTGWFGAIGVRPGESDSSES